MPFSSPNHWVALLIQKINRMLLQCKDHEPPLMRQLSLCAAEALHHPQVRMRPQL